MSHTLKVILPEIGEVYLDDIGSCKLCGGVTLHGVCMACHGGVVCAWCGKVRQPDGEHWMAVDHVRNKSTHTICPACSKRMLAERIKNVVSDSRCN